MNDEKAGKDIRSKVSSGIVAGADVYRCAFTLVLLEIDTERERERCDEGDNVLALFGRKQIRFNGNRYITGGHQRPTILLPVPVQIKYAPAIAVQSTHLSVFSVLMASDCLSQTLRCTCTTVSSLSPSPSPSSLSAASRLDYRVSNRKVTPASPKSIALGLRNLFEHRQAFASSGYRSYS